MEALKNGFLKIMNIVTTLEVLLSEIVLAALILVTVTGTITRYFLQMPFTWLEEFQLACVIWIVFLAGSAAFHAKAHVAIEMIVDLLPENCKKVINLFIGVVIFVVLVYVLKASVQYLGVFMRSGRTTSILKIPYTYIYGIVPISCVLMMLEYFHGLLEKNVEEEE